VTLRRWKKLGKLLYNRRDKYYKQNRCVFIVVFSIVIVIFLVSLVYCFSFTAIYRYTSLSWFKYGIGSVLLGYVVFETLFILIHFIIRQAAIHGKNA
jgi:hypothetical protein